MKKLGVFANLKIFMESRSEVLKYCEEIKENISLINLDLIEIFIMSDFLSFETMKKQLSPLGIKVGVQDLYWEVMGDTRRKSEQEKITLLLNDRYIFESLEEMSKELKTISREISLSKDSLKKNSDIQNSISNLNKIIDDLYEGYIEKMTVLDIEDVNGLLVAEEGLDADIQKSKKELIRVLEGEVKRKEG